MSPDYSYTAYGLGIASCLPCPRLRSGSGPPDVFVRCGSLPDGLTGARSGGVCYQATSNQLLLSVPGVARFLVSDGREILVERAANADDDDVRLFLLGPALGALLQQRSLLVFEGSAIEASRGAVALLGHSGAGKSTLAAWFHQRGRAVLADDLCVVSPAGSGESLVQPGYPQLDLWPDACQEMGLPLEEMRRVRPLLEKLALIVDGNRPACPVPLRRIYVLHRTNSRAAQIRELHGAEKLMVLINHTYRAGYVAAMGRGAAHFRLCTRVARQVPVIWVDLPAHRLPSAEFLARFDEDVS